MCHWRSFPIRESGCQRVSGWECGATGPVAFLSQFIHSKQVIRPWILATVVQDPCRREDVMIRRTYFSHYRMVNEAITGAVGVGAALLLSYLILWVRL